MASPCGGSTLTTSAPRSASTWAAKGPATKAEKSTTRTPCSSGPGTGAAAAAGTGAASDPVSDSGRTVIGVSTMTSRLPRSDRSVTSPAAVTCGSDRTSPGVRTGSQATPAARNRAIQMSRGSRAKNDRQRTARSFSAPDTCSA